MSIRIDDPPLTQALAITRAMLSAAKIADWDELQHLEEVREPLVRRQHPTDVISRAQIEQILAYDRQLQALLGNVRDEVGRLWQDEHTRFQAIAAYGRP